MINQLEETIHTSRLGARAISATVALLGLVVFATMLPFKADGQSAPDGKALFERRCNGCHALDADHEGPRPASHGHN